MKRIISIFCMACMVLGILSACDKKSDIKNRVAPKALSLEQQDIVDLLSSDRQELVLFDFQTEDAYTSMELWVETYENGELTNRPVEVNAQGDGAKPLNGQFAVLISQDEGMTFSLTIRMNDAKYSNTSEPVRIDRTLGRGYGPIDSPVAIEPGKEIVLYTSVCSANGVTSFDDQQRYLEQPELLGDYPYVQIIKCKFA